jgi:DNA ligase-1
VSNPWEVIADLESDNSRTYKEGVIHQEAVVGNTEFFRGLRAAYDSMITFGIRKVDEKTGDGRGISADAFWKVADQLANRELSGNAAVTAVNYLRMNATEIQWNKWYRRILIKDLRCGISETTINKMVSKVNADYRIPVFTCQLAQDGANNDTKMSGEKFIEVKLDGVRVITVVYPNGQVTQYSRNGKELVNFAKIKDQISYVAKFFAEPMVLDGEVMSASFQDLMKQIHRKENVAADDAVLHLFDVITLREFKAGIGDHSQRDRTYSLNVWYQQHQAMLPNVTVVGAELVNLDTPDGKARFKEINTMAIDGGFEGIMAKDPDARYECKRTAAWLKQKPVIEVSLAVIALEEGTGRNAGKLGALVCQGQDDGKMITVNVGSGLSDTQRDQCWAAKEKVIGSIVEVRADAVTKNQDGTHSLRFPRFVRFRGFEPGEKL